MKRVISFVCLLCLCLASCQKKKDPSPCQNKVLRTSFMHTPLSIDPRRIGEPISSCMGFMAFDGLTHLEEDGTASNSLAEKIDISEDHTTYTFHLRAANWTDGKPITAQDFEYSWKSILDPEFPSPCPYLFYPIKNAEKARRGELSIDEVGIKALDEKTFQVQLEHPTPYFLSLVGFCVFFPVPKHIDSENPEWFKTIDHNTVCCGPYKIESWHHDSEIVMQKNPSFWDNENVQCNGIHISIIQDQNTCLQMYEQGKLDWIGGVISEVSLDALTSLHKEGRIRSAEVGNTIFVSYNVNAKPFDNLNIRKAFAYAIDRKAITDHVTQLKEKPATQVFPPALTKNQNLDLIPATAKLAQAKEFFNVGLQELGLTTETFPKVKLMFPSIEVYKKVGQALQEQWRNALGVEVETDFCEMKVFFDRLKTKNYQLAEAAWWAQYPDPMNILERFRFKDGNKNYPGWENPKYVSLISQIETTSDLAQRTELLRQAEKVIVEDVPLTPVYHFDVHYLSQPYVTGVEISPISDVQFRNARIIAAAD